MPTTLIAAASDSAAALAASQILAFAAYTSALPTIFFDLAESRPRMELMPSVTLAPEEAPRALRGLGASVAAFVRLEENSLQGVAPLLASADALLIVTTRFPAGLAESLRLYRSLAEMQAQGRSGRVLQPWLLPCGWSSTHLPAIQLRDWQRDLGRLGGHDLRCLPLIVPWTSLGAVAVADPARLQAVGARVLGFLGAIAAGGVPKRPERGIEAGDPFPPPPEPSTLPLRLAIGRLHSRLWLGHGA